jgi:hypothetical protein
MTQDIVAIAAGWHRREDCFEAVGYDLSKLPDEEDPDFDCAMELDRYLGTDGDAELAWAILEEIWRTMDAENQRRVCVFAAGPMEDLVREHGPKVIGHIESKARQDPKFKRMLFGVWPPHDEERPDWRQFVKLLEDLGPVQSFRASR